MAENPSFTIMYSLLQVANHLHMNTVESAHSTAQIIHAV
jgi:hypothetical protein